MDWLTSTTAMELAELPESLVVIGGGYVGMEQAQLFAHLGPGSRWSGGWRPRPSRNSPTPCAGCSPTTGSPCSRTVPWPWSRPTAAGSLC